MTHDDAVWLVRNYGFYKSARDRAREIMGEMYYTPCDNVAFAKFLRTWADALDKDGAK